jgi:hypothetical protein
MSNDTTHLHSLPGSLPPARRLDAGRSLVAPSEAGVAGGLHLFSRSRPIFNRKATQ